MEHPPHGLSVARTHVSGIRVEDDNTADEIETTPHPSHAAAASSDAVIVTSRASADRKSVSIHAWYIARRGIVRIPCGALCLLRYY